MVEGRDLPAPKPTVGIDVPSFSFTEVVADIIIGLFSLDGMYEAFEGSKMGVDTEEVYL